MSIAIELRKAICVHINGVQLPYLCFVNRLCSVLSSHSASLKVPHCDNVTVLLVGLT